MAVDIKGVTNAKAEDTLASNVVTGAIMQLLSRLQPMVGAEACLIGTLNAYVDAVHANGCPVEHIQKILRGAADVLPEVFAVLDGHRPNGTGLAGATPQGRA